MDERELLIRAALDEAGSLFSDEERDEVIAFLDAGDYGLAVETLCDIVREERKLVSSTWAVELRQLGRRMGMDSATFDGIDGIVA